jgi:nicotinate-nucleotide adenylyltransferase
MDINVFKNTKFSIGLFGGSFNPPHAGHLFVANQMIDKLGLDYVIWIITSHNPLKDRNELMSFQERMKACQKITSQNPKIIVTDLEYRLNTNKTFETVDYLLKNYGSNNFILMGGSDILISFHLWDHWKDIWCKIKIAFYGRKNYQHKALKSEAAITFGKYRVTNYSNFKERSAPCWIMVRGQLINISSTQLRKKAMYDKKEKN